MPSYVTPKRATEYIFYVSLVSQANTKIFQANPTIAAGDFKVSIDGGALANPGTLPAVTPASSKLVKVTLSIAEMTGDNISLICSDASGAEWCDLTINIQTSLRQIDDLATPTNITAGTITTVTNLTNAPTAGDLTATMKASVNTEVDTALADVNLDHLAGTAASIPAIPAGTYIDQMMDDGTAVYDRTTDSLQAIRDRGDAAWITGSGAANPDVLITTTITGLANQTLWSLTAGSADDNAYNGCRFVITDASTAVQKCVGVVNIYSGATKTMSPLNDPGIFTIANGDAISIMADRAVHPDIDNTVLDIDPSTGNVGIDWGNVANKTTSNVLSGTSVGVATLVNGLAAGVITAAAIATDAIDADAIADSALDAGAFTAGAANKLADHVLRRKQANVEASANGDSVTDAGSVYGFVQQARQSNTVDNAGFLTVYETDGSTELEQLPLDTDAAADPVVGVG